MTFAHLHCHSEYSPLDGISKPKDLAKRAKELGQPAIAITDHGTMGGAIELYEACADQGIKAIIGFEAYVTPDRFIKEKDAYEKIHYHLILLAMNGVGYRNLLALMTESFGEGYYYKPRIDRALLEQYNEGLIVLSGCLGGELAQHLLHDDETAARETISWYRSVFGDRYYVEVQDHGQDDDRVYLSKVVPLASEMQVPVVATGDSHYNLKEDADTAEIIHAMQSQATLANEKRFRLKPKNAYYIKSTEEMVALFGHIEGAIENSIAIADRCTLEIELGGRLPFPDTTHVTGQDSPLGWLTTTCYDVMNTLCSKLGRTYPEEYYERLEYELSIIEQTGFAEYLILVYDFVKWARDRGIPAVPRGSAAGSLLLYLLGVSDIDPIEYGLTFERFLNPERVQMPDVDMDFADERRGEIFDYLVSRYGRDHVAQISTYAQIKAKSAVRDAAGVLGWEHTDKMRLSGMIPDLPVNITLTECLEKVTDLKKLYETDPKVKTVLDLALAIEGKLRTQGNHNLGVHAAGTIISGDPIRLHAPLQPPNRKDKVVVTQYSQKVLEHLGLLKMDVLGLSNLTMVERCVNLIAEHRGEKIDIRHIPDRDPATFAMLQRGETSTVFQLAGGAMTKYLKQLVPDRVRHLIAMVALYRPGPMQLIPSFIKRRHGREEVAYLHPDLEPILAETYGVLVYQDQVLKILQVIGGYSLGQADIVRRAMGKKEAETMAAEKERFLEGARTRGYEEIASELWDEIEPHAGYSFNQCVSGDTVVSLGGGGGNGGGTMAIGEMYRRLKAGLLPPRTSKYASKDEGPCRYCKTEDRPAAWRGRCAACHSWTKKFQGRGLYALSLDDDGRIRPKRIKDVHANGVRDVYRVILSDGKHIDATANHRHMTVDGWKRVDELRVGDHLLTMGAYEEQVYVPSETRVTAGEPTYAGARLPNHMRHGEMALRYIDGGHLKLESWTRQNEWRCTEVGCEASRERGDRIERAHLDGDRTNNDSSNLRMLCASHHKMFDYTNNNRRRRWEKGRPTEAVEVVSIEHVGQELTYDLEMDDPGHNWVANGIVTHNSHATAYGMLAYQTAYLKAHYPVEWTAAVLQTSSFKPDDLPPLIAEARDRSLVLLGPSINQSFVRFSVEELGSGPHGGRGLRYGLGAVKQVGETAAEAIVREREQHGPYRSLDDLIRRSNTSIVTAKTLEYLTKAGAFDAFGSRESILATLPAIGKALSSYKGKITRRKNSGKALDDVELATIPLVETFTPSASQYLDWELEALGLFLSDHPFARMAGRIEGDSVATLPEKVGQKVCVTAAVTAIKEITTKVKKEKMAIVTLGDLSGTIDAVVFPKTYRENPEIWRVGSILSVAGKIEAREGKIQLVVDVGAVVDDFEGGVLVSVEKTVVNEDSPMLTARELGVRLRESDGGLGDLKRNQKALSLLQQPGSTPYRIVAEDRQGNRQVVSPNGTTVRLTQNLVERMTWLLGEENVRVVA